MKRRRMISLLIVFSIVISSGITAFAQPSDTINHWAGKSINYMMSKQILNGYPDGQFRPDGLMTKAEFYKVINGLLGYKEKVNISFSDVTSGSWYYEEIQKSVAAGYIKNSALISPDAKITREEVARIIGTVFHLNENKASSIKFLDSSLISEDAKGYIGALKDSGYINGYPDGTFGPTREITRAEVVTMLGNMAGEILNSAGVFNQDVPKNMIITKAGVRLENMTIIGDLYVTEGIGNGTLVLDNVTVLGTVYIWGGGNPGIKIIDSNISKINAVKKTGTVMIELENSEVDYLTIGTNVLLRLDEDSQIDTLEVQDESTITMEKGSKINYAEINGENVLLEGKGNIRRLKANQKLMVNKTKVNKGATEEVLNGEVVREKEDRDETPYKGVITNVENLRITINKNDTYNLPSRVWAEIDGYYDGLVSIIWTPSTADTSKVGTVTFEGRVSGYSRPVTLTLIVLGDLVVIPVTSVTLDKSTLNLTVGGTVGTLVETVNPVNATNKSVTWSSYNTAVATVANGKVNPLAAGTAIITVKTVDGGKIATSLVTVAAPVSDTVINIKAIPGVVAPVRGATPVTAAIDTTQYTGTVTWSPVANPFAASTVYTANIVLTAKSGFTLTGVTANYFTVAGAATVTNAANSGVVTAVFSATGASVITATAILKGHSFGVKDYGILVTGATPQDVMQVLVNDILTPFEVIAGLVRVNSGTIVTTIKIVVLGQTIQVQLP